MGKRSNFARIEKDAYATPKEALIPVLPYLHRDVLYYEPCCGEGKLVKHLMNEGFGFWGYSDDELDARYTDYDIPPWPKTQFITNPPWSRELLHPIIENLSRQAGTWLLFDADRMHTRQASELIKRCAIIVSVGRVKWIVNSKTTGKDNCCWYFFAPNYFEGPHFYGR